MRCMPGGADGCMNTRQGGDVALLLLVDGLLFAFAVEAGEEVQTKIPLLDSD
jgi:hypothetical protein